MRLKLAPALLTCLMTLLAAVPDVSRASGLVYHGEFSFFAALETERDTDTAGRFQLRYLPLLEGVWSGDNGPGLRAELAGMIRGGLASSGDTAAEVKLDLYRCWLRLDRPRWELRVGLQKLNFGPARLLRVLRWFDTIDPNDPTGFSKGVTGLSLRGTPTPLSTLQGWLLLDDSGTQPRASRDGSFSGGGRLQLPLGRGEVAVTTHTRLVQAGGRENRLALDGNWDLGIGIWFEAMLQHQDDPAELSWVQLITLGMDYTFNRGNGLLLLGESSAVSSGESFPAGGAVSHVNAVMASYPLTLFDNLTLLWLRGDANIALITLDWGHLTDYWNLHLQGFWSDSEPAAAASSWSGAYPQKGIRLTAIYNH